MSIFKNSNILSDGVMSLSFFLPASYLAVDGFSFIATVLQHSTSEINDFYKILNRASRFKETHFISQHGVTFNQCNPSKKKFISFLLEGVQ